MLWGREDVTFWYISCLYHPCNETTLWKDTCKIDNKRYHVSAMSPERSTNHENEPWLFVNKDAESYHLSRSHQREKFLIHSHVQGRWRRRKARQSEVADQSGEDGEGQGHEKPEDTGLPEGNVVGSTPFSEYSQRCWSKRRLTKSLSRISNPERPVAKETSVDRL